MRTCAKNLPLLRAIDASANRATEGLRVVEDLLRFVHDDAHLVRRIKRCRHDIVTAMEHFPMVDRMRARDTIFDVGKDAKTAQESYRSRVLQLMSANFGRTKEALRSLSEFSKLTEGNSELGNVFEAIRYDIYTIEKAAIITDHNRERLVNIRICVLVGASVFAAVSQFESYIGRLTAANIGMIQLREKSLPDTQLMQFAKVLRHVTSGTNTLCVINDRVDIAAAVDADGVHVGQDDFTVAEARRILSPQQLVGVSTHNLQQAEKAVLDGADYLGVGPTFPSTTKSFSSFAGLSFVESVAKEISLPAFAIGGINVNNVDQVAAQGLHRVAVQAALQNFAECDQLEQEIQRLRAPLERARQTVSE